MHVISDKLRCPSDSNTEQYKSYRTSYEVLQTLTQNNACYIWQATMSFRYVISDTEQYKSYRTSYDVFLSQTQNNAYISDKLRCPSDTNTEQCMLYRTSYDVLQKLTQNNVCSIGQATISFRLQNRKKHVISDKLRCHSDTSKEQCMSYRTSYDILQTLTPNNAFHIGQATMSFRL
jgi:hypothetical protein